MDIISTLLYSSVLISGCSFLDRSWFFHIHALLSSILLSRLYKGHFPKVSGPLLCSSFLSSICPMNSSCLIFPFCLLDCCGSRRSQTSPFTAFQPRNPLHSKLRQVQDSSHLFSSRRDHCLSLPKVEYLEKYCFIYFVQLFNWFRQEDKSGNFYSTLARNWYLLCSLILRIIIMWTLGLQSFGLRSESATRSVILRQVTEPICSSVFSSVKWINTNSVNLLSFRWE